MSSVTPEPIMRLLGGVLAAKYLMVATQVDLFRLLHEQPLSVHEVASQINFDPRTTRILLDALVALQLLSTSAGCYSNTPVTAAFLSGQAGPDLRPVVRLWDEIVYPQWAELATALRDNRSTLGFLDFSAQQQEVFSNGVAALSGATAQALARSYPFGEHQRLLDLGGGTGSFLRAALSQHQQLHGTLYELPGPAAIARRQIASTPLSQRMSIVEGSFLSDQLPTGYDAVLLANVVHLFTPEHNHTLLQRIRQVVAPEARLLLVDFWTNAEHTEPLFAALLAGEFQIVTGEGDVYSVAEVQSWLAHTGWQFVEHKPLTGTASLIVAAPA